MEEGEDAGPGSKRSRLGDAPLPASTSVCVLPEPDEDFIIARLEAIALSRGAKPSWELGKDVATIRQGLSPEALQDQQLRARREIAAARSAGATAAAAAPALASRPTGSRRKPAQPQRLAEKIVAAPAASTDGAAPPQTGKRARS